MSIGVLGGTGPAGQGLALRLAARGHDVILGSRDASRAASIVEQLVAKWGDRASNLRAGDNSAAAGADLAVLATVWDAAVPSAAQYAELFAGRVVVCVANGMEKGRRELRPILLPEGSVSAAVQLAAPDAKVVTAFQHIPAAELGDLDHELDCDVMVASDHDDARGEVMDLIDDLPGLRAFDAGSLANAVGIEALTAALVTINIRHKGAASVHLGGVEARGGASR